MGEIRIGSRWLTIDEVVSVARYHAKVALDDGARQAIEKCDRALRGLMASARPVYGVNTGFGALSNVIVPAGELEALQANLIRSHAVGVGAPLEKEVVRAMMLLRANTLAKGWSGVRPQLVELLIEMLNRGVHPLVPEMGSVGASGDLQPLAHMALVLVGEGKAELGGKVLGGDEALAEAGLKPIRLDPKEGLALVNGTSHTTALGGLTVHDAFNTFYAGEAAAGLVLEALEGSLEAFDERIHRLKRHRGQAEVARDIRLLVRGSKLLSTSAQRLASGRHPHDPYSLRCIPQIMGPILDALTYAKEIVEGEVNSVDDNPLVFQEEAVLSGGNFHGMAVAIAMDLVGMAMTVLGNLSERRIARILDPTLNYGLPAFLAPPEGKPGLSSGLMAVHYTAAALASANKALAHPATADSIPTSANFEDFVSMGPNAALKARRILRNVERIVAIELLCGAQAADLRGPDRLGYGSKKVYGAIRDVTPFVSDDRSLADDIEGIARLISSGFFKGLLEELRAKGAG